MGKATLFPDFILESSWEVCNKVGGIYTVLSTRAKTLRVAMKDNLIFIGPDCWQETPSPYFIEDKKLLSSWKKQAHKEGLNIKVGRWNVPGNPIAVLVDFNPFFDIKDEIYANIWEQYGVDSLHGYGDYDEASMFSYAAGRVVESFYHYNKGKYNNVIYHGNEWMAGLGVLYIANKLPQIGTVFTTHATSIGRSIAGNNKPLYEYLSAYNGNQMADELNMQSKHSIELQTAKYVDCFTTVSDITANECKELLDKPVDMVLPNGFDDVIVPSNKPVFTKKRNSARAKLFTVANALTGITFRDDTLIVSTSGRYEFRNKGIDVFIDAVLGLRNNDKIKDKRILAVIEVPGWVDKPRQDLIERLATKTSYDTPLEQPYLTHWLHNMGEDNVLNMLLYANMYNAKEDNVTIMFVPCYLNGDDGIMNMEYYDLLLGNDLCVYPSYYEPWGYTPLEAVAFKVPCITTDLSGFGLWANGVIGKYSEIEDGVKVIHRTDNNYVEVANEIRETIIKFANLSKVRVESARDNASLLSKKALWSEFIKYYYEAYDIALNKAKQRK